MHKLLLFTLSFSLFLFVVSCGEAETSTETENTTDTENKEESTETPITEDNSSSTLNEAEYTELDADMFLEEYVGQKVWVSGVVSKEPLQHIMKESLSMDEEEEKNVYIDYNDGEQCLGYFKGITVAETATKFFGTVGKVSGPLKDGGNHTEYYINLDAAQ